MSGPDMTVYRLAREWAEARRALIDYANNEGAWNPEMADRLAKAEGALMRFCETLWTGGAASIESVL